MLDRLHLVYLDRYHLGDDLFLNDLAQRLGRTPAGEPLCLFVHGSGEKVERTLEGQGRFPERTDAGVLDVTDAAAVALVERALRETNQTLVARLTDEVVSAVGVQGVDRDVLKLADDGAVTAGRVGWLEALLKQRVVPVVSAMAMHPAEGRPREVPPTDALVALARALDFAEAVAVVFTTSRRDGLPVPEGGVRSAAVPEDVQAADVAEPQAVCRLARAGVPVLVTHLGGFLASDGPTGTRVEATN
jgi:hypothetical protein